MQEDISSEKFLQAYGNLLVLSWGNPALKKRLKTTPERVLKEFGLDPGQAKVVIEPPGGPPGWSPEATPESQVRLWNEGRKAGEIRLIYPEEPPLELRTAELSDQDLEAIAGGWTWGCACCTPCCCC